MIRMRATGVKEARLFLQNIAGRTSQALRIEMYNAAKETEKIAKEMVPEDTKALHDSIKVVEQQSSSHRYHVSVVAGSDTIINKFSGMTVSTYAAIVHENYEDYATSEDSMAARNRRRKEARTGRIVGSKFLTRALDEVDQTLAERLGRVLTLIGGYSK